MKITILLIVIVFMLPVSMPIMAETGTDDFKTTLLKAEQGQLNAQFNLGLIYELGLGIPKNTVEALKWYRKAAERGHPDAQLDLGVMYANGEGTTENSAEALKWLRRAAKQGSAMAQFSLGLMYAYGDGVKENDTQAVKWYALAKKQGYEMASRNLGNIQASMSQRQIDDAQHLAARCLASGYEDCE